MTMKPLRITERPALYRIPVQPGELITALLQCGDLFLASEPLEAVVADHGSVTNFAVSGHDVTIRIDGPADGEALPVALTLTGAAGTVRRVALVIEGCDPYTQLVAADAAPYLRYRGDWESAVRYAPMEVVRYAGLDYLALTGSQGRGPDLYPETWLIFAGTGSGSPGGSSEHATSLRAVIDGDTYELALGRDEFGGITTIITNLTGA